MSEIKNIKHSIPILRHSVTFLAGILVSDILHIRNHYLIIVILVFLCLTLLLKNSRKIAHQKTYSFVISLLIICFGAAYTNVYHNTKFNQKIPKSGFFTGKICEISPAFNNSVKLTIKLKSGQTDTSIIVINEKIVLFVHDSLSEKKFKPGSFIGFNAKLHSIKHSNNPGDFDFKKYMNRRGIRYQAYIYNPPYALGHHQTCIKSIALNTRFRLVETYKKAGIDNQELAVLSALTLGEKGYIDKALKQQFSNSGAMHVLAVSGLHVGIIFFVFSFMLKPLDYSRKTKIIKVLLLIIILWGYALITGMSPSVMRATTMFSFLVIGQNLKRNTSIYNTLALSALLLMIIKPDIIYEVGFQLSYTAVTSIIFFQPKIARLFLFKNLIMKSSWELFAVSLSAQIGTIPLSLYYFHQFPVYFWISNFIVIPAATILLYGSVFFFLMLPFATINDIIGDFLSEVAKLMNLLIAKIDNLPGAVISDVWIDWSTVINLYAIIFTVGLILISRKYKYLLILCTLAQVFFIKQIINSYNTYNQKHIVFYNHYNENILSIINGHEHYYYCQSDSLSAYSQKILNNSKGYFRTNDPVLLPRDTLLHNNLYRNKNYIFYQNIQIHIKENNYESLNSDSPSSNLTLKINYSEFNVNKKQNISLHTFKNGKLNYFRPINETENLSIKTNNYAMIVETW